MNEALGVFWALCVVRGMDSSVFGRAGLGWPREAVPTAVELTLPHLSLCRNSSRACGGPNGAPRARHLMCTCPQKSLRFPVCPEPLVARQPAGPAGARLQLPTLQAGPRVQALPLPSVCFWSLSFPLCKMEIVTLSSREWPVDPDTWCSVWHGAGVRARGLLFLA